MPRCKIDTDTDTVTDNSCKVCLERKARKKKCESSFRKYGNKIFGESTSHKAEAYVKPEVDKNICRDIFCKDHYEKPIIMPSSINNMQPPQPLFPPPMMPFYHQQRSMYSPAPPMYPQHRMLQYGYPSWGRGYGV
ncbi:hypothetical protein L1987_82092 [Smallanthus sonchifolius]|uniref:Uncharacterized protein n=1 Tax=Smallanthus sonchifolius TaxID=185202 RepID=A0ACB8YTH5_9ASTR|nr:hypothetical protein L1987_82092 [Smallanthus sonchifolius]